MIPETGLTPDVLAHRIAENQREIRGIRRELERQSSFNRWLVGLLVGIGMTVCGFAYVAHAQLAERLIEVGSVTNEQLGRIEERLNAVRDRLDRAQQQQ